MAHLTGLRGPRACIRASVATAITLSLLLVTAVEGSHSHEESDPPDMCSVCELAHQGAPTPAIGTAVIVEPGVLQTPAPPGNRLISGTAHLSAHRSRAPPLPISL
ncbi:MAG: hypothetical protein F4087_13625 [Gemmatimonadetes bacterium]|nr:hypothetical protein [Gemmatimonadota bacterium]MDE2678161.1 hypothetical protein [Gemmatimonadota bacterium]MXX34294.1 hypothetical protein [Gemmatimonadota bacterium]MYA10221.1 hypothetical protein [Gemmatimonadota bacterium]MYD14924.1 hypothetical protein [Gemmatimonadota bacterium]